MDWNIREASTFDLESLSLIGSATFLETFAGVLDGTAIIVHCQSEHSRIAYQRYLDNGGKAWLVEVAQGHAPIGFSLVGETSLPGSTSDGSDIELKRIYVLSRFHGSGVGQALMSEALRYAGQRKAKRLLLGVYAGNRRARSFYEKNGFVQISDRKFTVGDRQYDDAVLAKEI